MEKYVEFNPVKFLHDSKTWDRQIRELGIELASVSDLKGASESPGRSTDISDPVVQAVAERGKIQDRINHLNYYKEALMYAFNTLSDLEKDTINAFFYKSGYVHKNARKVAEKHGYNYPKGIYNVRREALEKLTKSLLEY